MRKETEISKGFKRLRSRVQLVERRYNPEKKNLHFDCLAHGDADLYPILLGLAEDGLKAVSDRHSYFLKHALYADGMFWYDFFLIVSAASSRVRADKAQAYISEALVDRLLKILLRMSRYSTVDGGDITKRNHEALGNTLLEFYNKQRVRSIRESARVLPAPMKQFLRGVIERVEEVRSERAAATPTGTQE